jgi:octaprenyl-diphosphate synthase
MQLEDIRALVREDLRSLDQTIRDRLASDVVLVNQVANYIIAGGGKRLRPLLVVLGARACGYGGSRHIEAAAIVEFIHTATLLHDDVVDSSELRRGKDTANSVFGNEASVLVGDFLYSRAFQMITEVGRDRVLETLADATNVIAEGEVLQLMNCGDPETTEARYLDVIRRKTAMLFEAGTRIAAIIAGQPPEIEDALAEYGQRLGVAFQLVDDVLDYRGDTDEMGKNMGDDLAEGKPTLPLIYTMHNGDDGIRAVIRTAIENGGDGADVEQITAAVGASGGLDYTHEMARREARAAVEALQALPRTPHREALESLTRIAVERSY